MKKEVTVKSTRVPPQDGATWWVTKRGSADGRVLAALQLLPLQVGRDPGKEGGGCPTREPGEGLPTSGGHIPGWLSPSLSLSLSACDAGEPESHLGGVGTPPGQRERSALGVPGLRRPPGSGRVLLPGSRHCPRAELQEKILLPTPSLQSARPGPTAPPRLRGSLRRQVWTGCAPSGHPHGFQQRPLTPGPQTSIRRRLEVADPSRSPLHRAWEGEGQTWGPQRIDEGRQVPRDACTQGAGSPFPTGPLQTFLDLHPKQQPRLQRTGCRTPVPDARLPGPQRRSRTGGQNPGAQPCAARPRSSGGKTAPTESHAEARGSGPGRSRTRPGAGGPAAPLLDSRRGLSAVPGPAHRTRRTWAWRGWLCPDPRRGDLSPSRSLKSGLGAGRFYKRRRSSGGGSSYLIAPSIFKAALWNCCEDSLYVSTFCKEKTDPTRYQMEASLRPQPHPQPC